MYVEYNEERVEFFNLERRKEREIYMANSLTPQIEGIFLFK